MIRIFTLLIAFWISSSSFRHSVLTPQLFEGGVKRVVALKIRKRRQKKSLFVTESPNEIFRYFDIISLVPLEFLCCVSDTIHIYSFKTPECDTFQKEVRGFVRLITFSMFPSPTQSCKTPQLPLPHPTPPPDTTTRHHHQQHSDSTKVAKFPIV